MEKRAEIEERLVYLSRIKKLRGFTPGIIEKHVNAKQAEVEVVLGEWIADGKLSVRFLLRNPERVMETKAYAKLEDIPIGEWFDEFQFGDEFQVDMDDVEKEYFFADDQQTEKPKPEPVVRPAHIDGIPIEVLDYLKAIHPYKERIRQMGEKYGVSETDAASEKSYRFDGTEYEGARVWAAYEKGRSEA